MRVLDPIGPAAVLLATCSAGVATAVGPNSRIEADRLAPRFGETMANAGDVNGDGLGRPDRRRDLLEQSRTTEGAVFVFYGRPGGFPATMTARTPTRRSNRTRPRRRLGTASLGGRRDNGDHYGDIVIGAGGWDGGQANEGAAFRGARRPNGIPSGGLEVASAVLQGDWVEARLGTTVGEADVNGDGYDDVISGGRLFQNDDAPSRRKATR
jgi:hypothetical protein